MPDVIRRWEMLISLLRNQLKGGVAQHLLDNTRDRVRRLALDTDRSLVQLPKPDFEDECFQGLRFGHPGRSKASGIGEDAEIDKRLAARQGALYLDRVKLPTLTDPVAMAKTVMELERLYTNARKRAKEYRLALASMRLRQGSLLAAKAAGRTYNPRHKRDGSLVIRPNRCWCGCGRMAGLVYNPKGDPVKAFRYARGHMLTYIKMVSLVERGFERWEDLPVLLKEGIKWGKCIKCQGDIPLVDAHGDPLEAKTQIGIACWRERMGVWWPYKKDISGKKKIAPRRAKVDPFNSSV